MGGLIATSVTYAGISDIQDIGSSRGSLPELLKNTLKRSYISSTDENNIQDLLRDKLSDLNENVTELSTFFAVIKLHELRAGNSAALNRIYTQGKAQLRLAMMRQIQNTPISKKIHREFLSAEAKMALDGLSKPGQEYMSKLPGLSQNRTYDQKEMREYLKTLSFLISDPSQEKAMNKASLYIHGFIEPADNGRDDPAIYAIRDKQGNCGEALNINIEVALHTFAKNIKAHRFEMDGQRPHVFLTFTYDGYTYLSDQRGIFKSSDYQQGFHDKFPFCRSGVKVLELNIKALLDPLPR